MSTLTQMCTNHTPTGKYFKCHVWKYQNKPLSFFFCPCHKSKDHYYPPVLQTRDYIIQACLLFEDMREKLAIVFPGIRMPRRSLGWLIRKKCVESTLEFLKSGVFSPHHMLTGGRRSWVGVTFRSDRIRTYWERDERSSLVDSYQLSSPECMLERRVQDQRRVKMAGAEPEILSVPKNLR